MLDRLLESLVECQAASSGIDRNLGQVAPYFEKILSANFTQESQIVSQALLEETRKVSQGKELHRKRQLSESLLTTTESILHHMQENRNLNGFSLDYIDGQSPGSQGGSHQTQDAHTTKLVQETILDCEKRLEDLEAMKEDLLTEKEKLANTLLNITQEHSRVNDARLELARLSRALHDKKSLLYDLDQQKNLLKQENLVDHASAACSQPAKRHKPSSPNKSDSANNETSGTEPVDLEKQISRITMLESLLAGDDRQAGRIEAYYANKISRKKNFNHRLKNITLHEKTLRKAELLNYLSLFCKKFDLDFDRLKRDLKSNESLNLNSIISAAINKRA